jgi:hypothetical protein
MTAVQLRRSHQLCNDSGMFTGARACMIVTLLAMPRWLWALIIILIILVFIVPDPEGAGEFLGEAIDALIAFFKAIADSVTL